MGKDVYTHRNNDKNAAVIFLHGFKGDIRKTWADFPWFLMADGQLNDWDIYSVGYDSNLLVPELRGLWKAVPDIQKLADTLATRIRTSFDQYDYLAFVAHSMGGACGSAGLAGFPKNYTKDQPYISLWHAQQRFDKSNHRHKNYRQQTGA